MKRLIQDTILPIAVLLALPLGMLGPALTLPLLVYSFPLVLAAIVVGLLLLLRGERTEERAADLPLQDLSGRPAAGGPSPEKFPSAVILGGFRRRDSIPSAEPLGGGPFRRILVLLNPDDYAVQALAQVAATAKRDDAEVVLASVVTAEEAMRWQDLRGNLTHHAPLVRLRLDKVLENLCWRLEDEGIRARRRVELAEPASQVPDLARREKADLVVLALPEGRLLQARAATPDWAQAMPCPVLALAS